VRVLVTGSSGFVGQHVRRELEKRDHELLTPSSQELNLLTGHKDVCFNTQDLIKLDLINHKVDAIVHLAATCGGIGINADNPGRFIYENLQMGINILEAARLAGVSKVVNLGSVCAYPKFTQVPFKEEDLWNGYPEETNAPYGIAKKTIIELGIAYARQYGMNVTNLLPANMAGEWDNFDQYSSHVIPALVAKFEDPHYRGFVTKDGQEYRGIMIDSNEIPVHPFVTLWGTGSASREFLYAGDCARAIAIALEKDTGPQPINLGTGQEITIRELANLVKRVGEYDAEITWDNTKPDGQPRRALDVSRAKSVLRWEATTSLEETVKRTIRWYREQQ